MYNINLVTMLQPNPLTVINRHCDNSLSYLRKAKNCKSGYLLEKETGIISIWNKTKERKISNCPFRGIFW